MVPLDYLIIDALHDEGELLGGYYPVGDTVAQLRKKHFSELTSDQLSARLRALMTQGIVVRVKGVGTSGNYLWQRTTTGKELLQQWQQTQKERA